jgi:hypothetical protein
MGAICQSEPLIMTWFLAQATQRPLDCSLEQGFTLVLTAPIAPEPSLRYVGFVFGFSGSWQLEGEGSVCSGSSF